MTVDRGVLGSEHYILYNMLITLSHLLVLAATIVQNKAVAEQGLEEGEEEENRGKEEVDDMGLGWMEVCCTALELHADEPAVQVGPDSSKLSVAPHIYPAIIPVIRV